MKYFQFVVLFVILLFFNSCKKSNTSLYPLAAENGFDVGQLEAAVNAARQDGGVKCLIINRNGENIVEEYFNDHPDSLYHVRSVTKSFMSLLFGIAIDQELLSIDQTIGHYLNQDYILNESVKEITIENLLTMTAGFEWDEFTNFTDYFNPWAISEDPVQHALDLNLIYTPGQVFTYNTSVSHILSSIFTKATGQSLAEFAELNLFAPLNMSENIIWYSDFQGFSHGGAMLNVTPIDMLKLGLIYLNNGIYNGEVVVSQEWVEASSFPHVNTNVNFYGSQYGYQWWVDSYQSHYLYFANGYGGQFVFVFPYYDLVVVARSNWNLANRSAGQQWVNTQNIIVNQVFASIIE